ncbi:aminopeptidase N [Herbidospora sp. NBRC 101105]|uniref:aminopeptidase N n=1 Tax=Herbidospora sp. NBRC 101105 TaxID=3032195 RepID=UPI0024A46BE6|nr:aminopeptidase N [Herbidospora sp. NBRC 101105]GLX97041.1 aminopeptidase N [Herbidospora sp. NBRC 101105]
METPNLTRDQARLRAELIAVESYHVALDLTGDDGFTSVTTVRFTCRRPGEATWIDLVARSADEAVLNGHPLDLRRYDPSEGVVLPDPAARNELTVRARCAYGSTGQGLHRFTDPADGAVYLYTHFQPADAKRVFACFDQPDLKAPFTLTVTAPASWTVRTNSPARHVEPAGDGTRRHHFAPTPPLPTYLVAVVAGPWAQWHADEDGEIPLALYCRASLASHMDAERLFAQTRRGLAYYRDTFGVPYPFAKYDQCFVPEFNAGAMENAACVTYQEDMIFRGHVTAHELRAREETVLHEMAHMWFGDLVTMRWWDDLWLNEAFATYMSVLAQAEATGHTQAWTTFANIQKAWAYQQDQLPTTHPVVADVQDVEMAGVHFDGITYAKGASLLRQLAAHVGADDFFTGLRGYFAAHAWGNATLRDLLAALEKASGRDLSRWSGQWLETTGLATLRPVWSADADGRFTAFAVEQSADLLRDQRVAVGVYADDGHGRLVRVHRQEIDVSGARTDVPELIGRHRGDLVLVNDDDLGYCKIRLDPASRAVLSCRIGDLADPLARALAWSAVWETTRDAEFRARDYVALIHRGLAAETDTGVLRRLLQQAHAALDTYADPDWSPGGWRAHATWLIEQAEAAEPGSDRHHVLINALLVGVLDESHLTRVRRLLEDPVDPLTRWRVVQALVAHGVAGDAEIDAELARGPAFLGPSQAERARALRPGRKEEAWRRAMHDESLPAATVEAVIGGFAHPAQKHLLRPYAARYLEEIGDVWRRRGERAQGPAMVLFPSWAVDQATVDAVGEWLTRTAPPPALARLVGEGRARLARALAARAFDRSS